MKRKLKIVLVSLMILVTLTVTGCLEDESSLGEPEDVFMDITNAEAKETDLNGDPPEKENAEFLWLEVEMTNEREENISIDINDFELEESSEEKRLYTPTQAQGLPYILQSGETFEFKLIFEIFKDDVADILWFNPPSEEGAVSWTRIPTY